MGDEHLKLTIMPILGQDKIAAAEIMMAAKEMGDGISNNLVENAGIVLPQQVHHRVRASQTVVFVDHHHPLLFTANPIIVIPLNHWPRQEHQWKESM